MSPTVRFQLYNGPAFSIEWYFDERGRSPAKEFFLGLPDVRKAALLALARRLGEAGLIRDETKFRSEGDKIFAFKPQPERFLCFFFSGRKVIVTNGFEKKGQKMPPGEKERALRAKFDYDKRVKRGVTMKRSRKIKSDYDEFISDRKRKKLVENEYNDLCLSEVILALMEQSAISVRELAKEVGVSPTVIQGIRTGKRSNVTLATLFDLTSALGAKIKLEIGDKIITLRE